MKSVLHTFIKIAVYLVIVWPLCIASILTNQFMFGRPTGGITAVGSLASFWIAYRVTKWFSKKYLRKQNEV
jgi:hypothetical protein